MECNLVIYFQELLHNIDPLWERYGSKKEGSPFDNTQQAALRVGDWKIVTGTIENSGWYEPVSLEGSNQHIVPTAAYLNNNNLYTIQ